MQIRYIVTYDICDSKRLHRVFKTMEGFGDHLQYSVFSCDLSATERVRCESELRSIIDAKEDQVLFIALGPTEGRGKEAISALGRPYVPPERRAIVA